MSSTQIIASFLVLLAVAALWLDYQNRLVPVLKAMTSSNTTVEGVGKFAFAFVVYLIAMSFLSPGSGLALTVLLVAGALLVDQQNATVNGTSSTISTLFGSGGNGTGLSLNIPGLQGLNA